MNKIDSIIIHCSATRTGLDLRAKDIDRMHKQRGFTRIGYNFVIDLDGTVENGRPLSVDGAHCNTKGFSGVSYNKHSIGICYIGGLDAGGQPADLPDVLWGTVFHRRDRTAAPYERKYGEE